ncbi:MAG: ATP-binding protein [Actinomycetota bacterium]|nr:ATP-binding protein [Actinomycetota bacterium]
MSPPGDVDGGGEPGGGPLGGVRAALPAVDPLGRGSLPGGPLLREGGEVTVREVRAACAFGVCDGSGWIVGPDDIAQPCECRKRRIERARSSGMQGSLPKRYRGVSFDRPPISDMALKPGLARTVAQIRGICERIDEALDAGEGAWLMGDVGTGKTSLAMLVSKAALEDGHSVAIYSLPRLLARIRRTYDTEAGEEGYLSFFNRLTSVDLLHLDDLGAEKRTDWVLEQLYAIVDRRYEEQRSMVLTTNLDVPALEEQIGKRTVSRLVEMCGDPLPLYGADERTTYRLPAVATPTLEPPQPS